MEADGEGAGGVGVGGGRGVRRRRTEDIIKQTVLTNSKSSAEDTAGRAVTAQCRTADRQSVCRLPTVAG